MTPIAMPLDLAPHRLKIALIAPQIAPNTGNIARLCVATGTELHLVRPLGFVLSDRNLRRSAMDYWPRLQLHVHDDLDAFQTTVANSRRWLFTSKARQSLWQAHFENDDWLIFGNETHGLPASFVNANPAQMVRIPQSAEERCLNLSTAVGIGLYEALRQSTRG
jgi:tRNA (cytidine/uridine-2'-O-)-methyltransferase